ncbi:UNVERIFIED_CONTAM: hypothetical protein Sangu_2607400 [Sesamum angustifolium]|uniref:Uncharacterized protein n=1 Tax=Sesamum angustifolium TaxID=2727405 RepID=A0AAW2J503_9LAMI
MSWGISQGTDSSGGGNGALVPASYGDPPPTEVEGVPITTCKAWELLSDPTTFCLFAVLLESPLELTS